MKLILHAGPMKTGSTAFQDLLACNREALHQSGIRFRWLRLPELDDLQAVMRNEEQKGWPELLLLSHECLCRVSPERLRSALAMAPESQRPSLWQDRCVRFTPVFIFRISRVT